MVCKDGGEDNSPPMINHMWQDEDSVNNATPRNVRTPSLYEGENDLDDDWTNPLTKIVNLSYDHESWQHAHELLDAPSPECRKIGDEARSIAARHIIDRLKEENLLSCIHEIAPRIRSAVELLSKTDADCVYPPFQYVLNEMRRKFPSVYKSVVDNVELKIPDDMHPSAMLISLAKSTVEDSEGELQMTWGKFTALLGLSGALAIDSVKSNYPDGVVDIVETFGVITEQVMGEWILSPEGGGGWLGFIRLNVYQAFLPPVPRTIVILLGAFLILFSLCWIFVSLFYSFFGHYNKSHMMYFAYNTSCPANAKFINECSMPMNPYEVIQFYYFYVNLLT